jgi:hypothetical protein
MAVTAVPTVMSGAINYTFTTDTSADFASVANSTYFYNKADKLVRYKDSTGAVLEIFSASGGASGVWGISNASGVYTYYTTLTLAMAAAVSGNVIEMFADVTETGAVSVTLKTGVNINGNGHTYYHTNATADLKTLIVSDTINTEVTILNLNVIKSNSSGPCIYLGTNGTGTLIFTGSKLIHLGTGECVGMFANADYEIINLYAKATSNNGIRMSGFSSKLTNCYGYSTSGNGINIGNSAVTNCTGISNSGVGLSISNGKITDCTGISSGTHGIVCAGGVMNNCKGFSSGANGIHAFYCNIYSCFGYSTAGVGIWMVSSPTFASDCTGYSTSSYGIHSAEVGTKSLVNCTAISDAATALYLYGHALNCSVICNWNNVAGHGILLNGIATITNCTIKTTNATANSIIGNAAYVVKYANNSYVGPTTPVNANVTQGIVNSQDNQGNMLI